MGAARGHRSGGRRRRPPRSPRSRGRTTSRSPRTRSSSSAPAAMADATPATTAADRPLIATYRLQLAGEVGFREAADARSTTCSRSASRTSTRRRCSPPRRDRPTGTTSSTTAAPTRSSAATTGSASSSTAAHERGHGRRDRHRPQPHGGAPCERPVVGRAEVRASERVRVVVRHRLGARLRRDARSAPPRDTRQALRRGGPQR